MTDPADVTAADDPSGYGMHAEPPPAPTYPPGCTHPTWTGDRCAGCGIGRRAAYTAAASPAPVAPAALAALRAELEAARAAGWLVMPDDAEFASDAPVIVAPEP